MLASSARLTNQALGFDIVGRNVGQLQSYALQHPEFRTSKRPLEAPAAEAERVWKTLAATGTTVIGPMGITMIVAPSGAAPSRAASLPSI